MAAEAEVGTEAPAKKGIPKLFIFIGAAVVVVLLGGAGLFFFLSSGSSGDAAAAGEHGAAAAGDHAAAAGEHGADGTVAHDTFIFNLPPMMVNLKSEGTGSPS